ncbi:MAG: precorrin-3B C(17)-methyltransferase [Nitrospirae bacterium]|nr:precorrin-3B C(17)-methyltransferase [Nitrospirota bacterium]
MNTENNSFKEEAIRQGRSTLYIVGIGPGAAEHITYRAIAAIEASSVIVGYSTYLELIGDLIKDKTIIGTGMTQEVKRCTAAIDEAASGRVVSVISSGDPGVYAMAGLVLELIKERDEAGVYPWTDVAARPIVEVIPGVPALCAAGAALGAPLMHDFAAISLSDRLTPWELIERRLHAAASADFVIVIYNPKSKGRPSHIDKARHILLKYKKGKTPAGIVKGAARADERITITTIEDMLNHEIDMQTTIVIGNSQSFSYGGWMITPRGYRFAAPEKQSPVGRG